jgi:CheY-like chemotaxis protein
MLQFAPSATPPTGGGTSAPRRALRRLDGRAIRVLVVEDEAYVALDLAASIEALGGEVTDMAATESEAVRLAGRDRPDVVLMDIRLASGDGIEAARAIRAHYGTPIVFATGNTEPETMRRITGFGAAAVVSKPITPDLLRDAILRACDE